MRTLMYSFPMGYGSAGWLTYPDTAAQNFTALSARPLERGICYLSNEEPVVRRWGALDAWVYGPCGYGPPQKGEEQAICVSAVFWRYGASTVFAPQGVLTVWWHRLLPVRGGNRTERRYKETLVHEDWFEKGCAAMHANKIWLLHHLCPRTRW